MKRFQWEHTEAATISEIFYKYQRNDDKRARVQSSLLWRQKPNIQLQMHGACLKIELVTPPWKALNVRNCVYRALWSCSG